jgi:hypothetical protein
MRARRRRARRRRARRRGGSRAGLSHDLEGRDGEAEVRALAAHARGPDPRDAVAHGVARARRRERRRELGRDLHRGTGDAEAQGVGVQLAVARWLRAARAHRDGAGDGDLEALVLFDARHRREHQRVVGSSSHEELGVVAQRRGAVPARGPRAQRDRHPRGQRAELVDVEAHHELEERGPAHHLNDRVGPARVANVTLGAAEHDVPFEHPRADPGAVERHRGPAVERGARTVGRQREGRAPVTLFLFYP